MFSKQEIKEILLKLINKKLFPDFSNKLTWYVVTLGGMIIVTPQPVKLIITNWLIGIVNNHVNLPIKLPELSSGASDYILGFLLITLALFHNIGYKWFSTLNVRSELLQRNAVIEIDRKLFDEFIKLLPSTGRSMYLLSSHDFENSFNLKSLTDFDTFTIEWNSPEKTFLDPEIEHKRKEFWSKCNEFQILLATKSSPTHGGFQAVVPDRYRGDFSWPSWVDDDVKSVNTMATELFKMHQAFVMFCRSKLAC